MHRNTLSPALRIAGIYTLLGTLWIVASDTMLNALVRAPHAIATIQIYKAGVL